MNSLFLAVAILVMQATVPQQSGTTVNPQPQNPKTEIVSAKESSSKNTKSTALSKIRRVFVESFGADLVSQQMQAMVIAGLTESTRFTVTEDKSKADAILKGVATEKTTDELHAYGSGTAVGTAHGGFNGTASGHGGNYNSSISGGMSAAQSAISDSSVNTESIDHAHASVRLINNDGDVIWTTTQESKGAKFKGASADVAEKIVKQLARDAEKSDKAASAETVKN
jgi:hypothetical protein